MKREDIMAKGPLTLAQLVEVDNCLSYPPTGIEETPVGFYSYITETAAPKDFLESEDGIKKFESSSQYAAIDKICSLVYPDSENSDKKEEEKIVREKEQAAIDNAVEEVEEQTKEYVNESEVPKRRHKARK